MPDYVILVVMALVVIYWLLSIFTAIRKNGNKLRTTREGRRNWSKFFKLDIIDRQRAKEP